MARFKTESIFTAPFTYVRWLGDHQGIEANTPVWNESVMDRSEDIDPWVSRILQALEKRLKFYGYVPNHVERIEGVLTDLFPHR